MGGHVPATLLFLAKMTSRQAKRKKLGVQTLVFCPAWSDFKGAFSILRKESSYLESFNEGFNLVRTEPSAAARAEGATRDFGNTATPNIRASLLISLTLASLFFYPYQ